MSIVASQALLTSIWAISCDSSDLYNFFLFRSIRMISFWQGNDILSNIRQDEYEEVIQMLENAILATDLALYFKYAFIFSVICLKSTPLFEFLFLSAKFFFCIMKILAMQSPDNWWTGDFCGLVYFVFCSVWFLWAY